MARAVADNMGTASLSEGELLTLVRQKYFMPESPALHAFIERFRELHGPGLRAVVFYGSRLSESTRSANSIYDFFLFADDYRSFYRDPKHATLNRVLPPNTYYAQVGSERAKYNVVSMADFRRETSERARDLFHAGRFSKRVGLVWASDEATREELLRSFVG